MAELQASYIQASSHPADTDRLVLEGLMNPAGAPVSGAAYGVGRGTNELKVQAFGTPNMSVDVLSGHAWIDGTEGANQGAYHVYNDATKNLVISAAHATLARKDLVVAKVQDAAYSGAVNAWSLAVVTGTPAGSPAEPAVPANAIVLALVDVAAAAASITNANITDRRRRASGLGGVTVCTSATRPASPYVGQPIYETDTQRLLDWNGTNWTAYRLGNEPDQFFAPTLSGGAAAGFTAFYTNNSILALPYPYRMIVQAHLNTVNGPAANVVTLRIADEAGGQMNAKTVVNGDWINDNKFASLPQNISMLGWKDYAAGATCGFRLLYLVSASTVSIDGFVRVSFMPRP